MASPTPNAVLIGLDIETSTRRISLRHGDPTGLAETAARMRADMVRDGVKGVRIIEVVEVPTTRRK